MIACRNGADENRSGATYSSRSDPSRRAVERLAVQRGVLLRVDHRDGPGRGARERLHLVLHEGDERRDDERQVVAHQGGQLVAQRLARAGRHDDEDVPRRRADGRAHGLLLPGPEGLVAEVGVERAIEIHRPMTLPADPAAGRIGTKS